MSTRPAAIYSDIEKSITTEALKKQGITVDTHETIQLGFGSGTLVTGKQIDDKIYRKWLLVAQAQIEAMPIVSVDAAFDPYGVTRIW